MGKEGDKISCSPIRGEDIEIAVQAILVKVFRQESLSVNDNLFDLGLSSIQITFLLSEINNYFSVELDIDFIFKTQTIKAISRQLSSILRVKYLSARLDERSNDNEDLDVLIL